MSNLSIRQASQDDWRACAVLLAALMQEEGQFDHSPEQFEQITQVVSRVLAGGGFAFLAELGTQPIGMIMVSESVDTRGKVTGTVFGLYITPNARGATTAKSLIDHAVATARERDLHTLDCVVAFGRRAGYYESIGAKPIETIYRLELV